MNIQDVQIYGAGAAGSNLLQHLICVHPELTYTSVDSDKVEFRNVQAGTQPYLKTDIGRSKVQSLQRIVMVQFGQRIKIVNQHINDCEEILDHVEDPQSTLIVDAFDNAASRNLFAELSDEYNVLHVGFSAALTGEAAWDNVWQPMTETSAHVDVCQMHLARPFIMALTSMAAIICSDFIQNGTKKNLYFDHTMKTRVFA